MLLPESWNILKITKVFNADTFLCQHDSVCNLWQLWNHSDWGCDGGWISFSTTFQLYSPTDISLNFGSSSNAKWSPQSFLTFTFNTIVTVSSNFKVTLSTNPILLHLNQDLPPKRLQVKSLYIAAINPFIKMLELSNFCQFSTSTIKLDSSDSLLSLMPETKVLRSQVFFRNAVTLRGTWVANIYWHH